MGNVKVLKQKKGAIGPPKLLELMLFIHLLKMTVRQWIASRFYVKLVSVLSRNRIQ